ncbi:MAG TPA: hypothetical protein PLK30_08415 [Blastocatellia bacterium]|nr:hypothetical protein [Blastocatellia bacterium]
MALHRKREESGRSVARVLLESTEPIELPPAEFDEQNATIEREEFRQYLPELFFELREGCWVDPAPMVQSDSIFIIQGETRDFWVRIWHADNSRTSIAKMHVLSCLPPSPNLMVNFGNQMP